MVRPTKASSAVPLGKLLVLTVALATVGAGIVHIGVAGQHLEHALLLVGFLLMGVGQVALAGSLTLWPSRPVLAAGAIANLAILAAWTTTRVTGVPFVPGLEDAQPIGLADLVVLVLEAVAIAAAGMALLLPGEAARSRVASGRRVLVGVGSLVLALAVPGLIAPHSHPGGHGHRAEATALADSHGHDAAAPAGGHGKHAMTYDEAHDALMGHDAAGSGHGLPTDGHPTDAHRGLATGEGHEHGSVDPPATGGHGHGPAQDHPHVSPGEPTRRERQVLKLGDGYLAYEPATKDGSHSSAFRWHGAEPANHHHYQGTCTPTTTQKAAADRISSDMTRALAKYNNNPWRALRDGFVAYPIPLSKMFHMVAVNRYYDGKMLDAYRVESFMYAMTDKGLTAVGGMFIFPFKNATPPNPTGCMLVWHRHTGGEGAVTSFDPQDPDTSVWMAHVWTFGGLDPWGRDFDGTEPHAWFFAYRYLPVVCAEDGDCI